MEKTSCSLHKRWNRVRQRHQELWAAISQLTGRAPHEIYEARLAVQRQIEQIRTAVLRKHAEKARQESAPLASLSVASTNTWQVLWNLVRRELTEPPSRTIDLKPLEEETGYHTVVSNVDVDVKDEVEANRQRYPGVRIFVRTRRIYPRRKNWLHT